MSFVNDTEVKMFRTLDVVRKPESPDRESTQAQRIDEERCMAAPVNRFNLRCTISETSVDSIMSAIYPMVQPPESIGLDFPEVGRQTAGDVPTANSANFANFGSNTESGEVQ